MTASESVDPSALWREQIESASPDLLRAMVKTFADALMKLRACAPEKASDNVDRSIPGGNIAGLKTVCMSTPGLNGPPSADGCNADGAGPGWIADSEN